MQEVLALAPAVLAMPASECELLYGRAGYLYALLFLHKHLGPAAVSADTACTTAWRRTQLTGFMPGAFAVASEPVLWRCRHAHWCSRL